MTLRTVRAFLVLEGCDAGHESIQEFEIMAIWSEIRGPILWDFVGLYRCFFFEKNLEGGIDTSIADIKTDFDTDTLCF